MRRHSLVLIGFVVLANTARASEPSFPREVGPLLYKLGCSAGACHGSFSGKGGFRLSLFAGNTEADYQNIRGGLGRRLDPLDPEQSLFLLKPTGSVPHQGGVKLARGGWEYQLILDWIKAGARFDPAKELKVLSVRVDPPTLNLPAGTKPRQLRVLAKLSDDKEVEVTRFVRFESLDPSIAEVDSAGTVTGVRAGDIAVLAHYAGHVAFSTTLVPGPVVAGLKKPEGKATDVVDTHLEKRLDALNIVASPLCDDLDFLRRAHLDIIGQLPRPEEIRAFQADKAPDKRAKRIDRLLEHPLHAALWAGKMCDMVGADDRFLGDGVYNFHDWFRGKLEKNTPWDEIAYGVIVASAADERPPEKIMEDLKREAAERAKAKDKTAVPAKDDTPPWRRGYATRKTLEVFYNNLINQQTLPGKPRMIDSKKIALRVSHTFLGVRLECAQCHKHPNDRWTQQDFFSFAMAFAHVEFGPDPSLKEKKVNLAGTHPTTRPVEIHTDPDTQEPLSPRLLGGVAIEVKAGVDPRREVWSWLLQKDNPYFAQALVNRVWGHYLARGLVEPVDGLAAANPPSHPEVIDELVKEFVASKYDLRKLHRRILNLAAYQRDWRTNPSNAKDERNYAHRLLRRLSAEQALDAIAQVTDTPIKLPKRFGTPRDGVKAVEVALSRVGGDDGYVLQIFGRPIRVQNCDCERSEASSLSQTLYLFNDEKLIAKIHDDKGRLKKLVEGMADDGKLVEELYLWTLSRFPTAEERDRSVNYVRGAGTRLEGYQDIMWSLMNRHDFVVNR
jgi:hypothetical protein